MIDALIDLRGNMFMLVLLQSWKGLAVRSVYRVALSSESVSLVKSPVVRVKSRRKLSSNRCLAFPVNSGVDEDDITCYASGIMH